MPKNTKIFIVALILFMIFFGINFLQNVIAPNSTPITGLSKLQEITVGETKMKVEVVSGPTRLASGLGNRDSIGSDGMLFILPQRQKAGFWMKEMRFDLDLIWIKDNKIIEITANVPYKSSNSGSKELPIYYPKETIDWVLEIPSGQASKLGLKLGDQLLLR